MNFDIIITFFYIDEKNIILELTTKIVGFYLKI